MNLPHSHVPQTDTGPASVHEVLHHEISKIRPVLSTAEPRALENLYQRLAHITPDKGGPLSALCLSGGGIRSATFNLGVVQKLAQLGLLKHFDYLSSVSGGGYIAAWLRTWMYRVGTDEVIRELSKSPTDPLHPEPAPVTNLRNFSNYLTPKLGLLSGDTWAAAAIILRNLILNWLVILPLLAAVIGLPQLFLVASKSSAPTAGFGAIMLWAALITELIAAICLYWMRRFAKTSGSSEQKPFTQAHFVLGCTFPVVLAAGMLAIAAANLDVRLASDSWQLWGFAVLWCAVMPILGWAVIEIRAAWKSAGNASAPEGERCPDADTARRRASWIYELGALAVSGLVAAAVLVGVASSWFAPLHASPIWYVILALPILLGIYLIARTIFIALASLSEGICWQVKRGASDDNDREWWARMSGWILLIAVSWTLVTAICLLGHHVPTYMANLFAQAPAAKNPGGLAERIAEAVIASLGGAAGILAALLGSSEKDPASPNAPPPLARRVLRAIAAPLFAICLVILLAQATGELGGLLVNQAPLFDLNADFYRSAGALAPRTWMSFGLMLLGLVAFAFIMGTIVNVNRFSLHGMYRNRLVRAYLGASSEHRKPDPFTGFAWSDNPKLHELWQPGAERTAMRPFPIINTTLNLVHGEKLAWQQRKADTFSMTPFYCGNVRQGYRRTQEYGGPTGISVGTAVTISGAAANPNMGFNSSPVLGFLMALFNVRLGAWLGNTNEWGKYSFRFSSPRQAIRPFLAEIFGLTNSRSRYVNLSDGGHFDNLGLYEVILRRCRHVLVSDAGCDGRFSFEDLGNAIRKIRIDFGIRIEFQEQIRIAPKSATEPGLYCALATIRYSDVDRTPKERDGQLIYIKPTVHGAPAAPYDVYSYSRSSSDFPHETTADQWFSESQFESYRALGFHTLQEVSGGGQDMTFEQLLMRALNLISKKSGSGRVTPRTAPEEKMELDSA